MFEERWNVFSKMGKWPMSPICTLVWHNLSFSWMQPLFKHGETRKKDRKGARMKQKKPYKFNNLKMYRSCYVKPEVEWVRSLMFWIIFTLTCCCIYCCSGWLETETVTVGSSALGRRGSRCAARTGEAMRPAVNCRGRAAKIRHWHWHTAAGVEVRLCQYAEMINSQRLETYCNLSAFRGKSENELPLFICEELWYSH